jgi:hypothetical protein
MAITTLDDLIAALQDKRAEAGNADVAVRDADTSWDMKISGLEYQPEQNRVIIELVGYGEDGEFPRTIAAGGGA